MRLPKTEQGVKPLFALSNLWMARRQVVTMMEHSVRRQLKGAEQRPNPTSDAIEIMHFSPCRGQSGFTLIELMIVVAVVGILAAVAYPSYLDQIRKSRRADAQAALMNVAGRQQQYLLDTRTYSGTLAGLNVAIPASVSANYSLSLAVSTGTVPAFTVTATPLAAQAADKCADLAVTETGAKTPPACW